MMVEELMWAGFRGKRQGSEAHWMFFFFPVLLARHLVLAASGFSSVSMYMCVCVWETESEKNKTGLFAEQCLNLSSGTARIRSICLINVPFFTSFMSFSYTHPLPPFSLVCSFLFFLHSSTQITQLYFRECCFQVIAFSIVQVFKINCTACLCVCQFASEKKMVFS